MRIAVAGASCLAVQVAPGLAPGDVVYDSEVVAPEDGGTMGHGQHTSVDETCERRRPRLASAYGCLRPAAVSVGLSSVR